MLWVFGFPNTGSAAELAVVVAGDGGPHLEHVDGVVEVSNPAFASEVEVALLALLQEHVPVLLRDAQLDADLGQILLDGLGDGNVAGGGVGQVLKLDGVGGGELAVLEGVAGSLEQLDGLGDGGVVIVVDGVGIVVALLGGARS